MLTKRVLFLSILCFFLSLAHAKPPQSEIIAASDVRWGYLNPLRGALSPGAADLWGNRSIDSATGMLVRFNKGFASPPHIHNITYRGIVIDGLLHNDDPKAEKLWMPSGSFWTQPAGENHVTAADAAINMIYLEIDSGPYLVKPSSEHFDNGERPLNIHWNNLVWVDSQDITSINPSGIKRAELWRNDVKSTSGVMLKLAPGFSGNLIADKQLRIIVIKGNITYQSRETKPTALAPGSYIGSNGAFAHSLQNQQESDIVLYVRSEQPFRIE